MNVSRTKTYVNNDDNSGVNSFLENKKDTSCTEDITLLQQKLQYVKNDRKLKENNAKALEHRVKLLQNQEKQAVQKFENTRQKFEKIINNRSQNKSKSKEKDFNFSKLEKRNNNSSALMSTQGSKQNFISTNHMRQNSHHTIQQNENMINISRQEEKNRKELIEKRNKLKEILIIKLMEEEKERLELENMLANIEKEEINLINNCKINNFEKEIITKAYDSNSNYKKSKNS